MADTRVVIAKPLFSYIRGNGRPRGGQNRDMRFPAKNGGTRWLRPVRQVDTSDSNISNITEAAQTASVMFNGEGAGVRTRHIRGLSLQVSGQRRAPLKRQPWETKPA